MSRSTGIDSDDHGVIELHGEIVESLIPPPVAYVARADTRRWAVVVSLLVATLSTGTLLVLFSSVYMVNDDTAMASFASGAYTGRPSAHLVFIGALPGIVLGELYRTLPNVSWYGVLLLASQAFCLAFVGSVCWARRRSLGKARCLMLVVVVAAYAPTFTLTPTFTVTATLIATTAVVALLIAVDSIKPSRRWLLGIAGVGLVAGFALRWDAAAGTAVVFLPTLAVLALRMKWRTTAVYVGAALMLVTLVHVTDLAWGQRGQWPTYDSYNQVRGQLHGTAQLANALKPPISPSMRAALTSNGWTADDVELFDIWFFDDPAVYSKEHLARLLNVTGSGGYSTSLGTAFRTIVDARGSLFALLGLCALLGVAGARRRSAAFVVVQLAWALGVYVLVSSRLRFPDRVALPSLFMLSVLLILGSRILEPVESAPRAVRAHRLGNIASWSAVAAAILLLLGPIQTDRGPLELSRRSAAAQQRFTSQLTVLQNVDRVGRFVAAGAALDEASVAPLDTVDPLRTVRLLSMGWPIFSPHYERRKQLLGLEGDLLTALVAQTHVYLIATPSSVPSFQRVYLRRLGVHVTLHSVAVLPNQLVVFQVRASTLQEVAADVGIYSSTPTL